jgi:MSHA biogenesis protein MshQ
LTSGTTVGFGYECNNPSTCSGSNLLSVTGTPNPSTVISRNNSGAIGPSSGTFTDVTLNFDGNGNAPFTFNYLDAGQIRLWARKTAAGALLTDLAGSSNNFVTRPASLQVTGGSSSLSPNNPGSSSLAGSVFAVAGDVFNITVQGRTSGGAVTPNFGNESTTPTVTFVNAANVAGNISTLVAPTTGTPSNGVLATGTSTSGNSGPVTGTVAVTGNRWSEVGAFTLRPYVSDYLGAGIVAGVQSGTIGRFRPYQYAVSGSLTACTLNTFAYAGRPLSGTLTVTAQNLAGSTTTNYGKGASSLATLAASQLVFGNVAAGLAVDTASTLYSLAFVANQDFNTRANGTAQISAAVPVRMTTTPVAPITSGLALTGTTDEVALVASAPASVLPVATVPFRAGRLRLVNAYGSELLPLRVPVRAEFFNSSGVWQLNTDDNCTTIPVSAVAGAPAGTTVTAMTGGIASIILPAQAAGVRNIALNLGSTTADNSCQTGLPASTGSNLPWMQFAWCAGRTDPNARVSFGNPRAPFIYLRERY